MGKKTELEERKVSAATIVPVWVLMLFRRVVGVSVRVFGVSGLARSSSNAKAIPGWLSQLNPVPFTLGYSVHIGWSLPVARPLANL